MSDILIKGMEIPTSCEECQFNRLDPTGEILLCDLTLFAVSWAEKERPFDCPLVEVPEQKHGKWMGEYNGWEDDYWCSECKSQALYKEGGSHDQTLSEYCPNCGAKMDGDFDV